MCQKDVRNLPAAASTEGGTLQTPANMPDANAHIEHYKFRLVKHLSIYALEDKVLFPCGIQCYQEGFIDIAVAEFTDVNNGSLRPELFCNGKKIVQVFPLELRPTEPEDILLNGRHRGQRLIRYNHREHFLKASS